MTIPKYILTSQCDLSKFIEAYSLPREDAEIEGGSFADNFILN